MRQRDARLGDLLQNISEWLMYGSDWHIDQWLHGHFRMQYVCLQHQYARRRQAGDLFVQLQRWRHDHDYVAKY